MRAYASQTINGANAATDWANSFGQAASATTADPASAAQAARGKIKRAELVDLTSQLAIMLRSGVDLTTALQSLARQCRRPALASVVDDVHEAVLGGTTFSQALEQHVEVFGRTYVATVAAGEASGNMSHVLRQLAQLERGELRLTRIVRSLMAYPVLLAGVSSLVIVALVLFVLPQFAEIFRQYETPLPFLTKILIVVAEELRNRWFLHAPIAGGVVFGALLLKVSPLGRRLWDWTLLNTWLVKEVSQRLIVGRSCRLMGLMIESGVPLPETLKLARQAVSNTYYRDVFAMLEEEVINGRGLSAVLHDTEIIPPSASEMISTAERTGNLGEVTQLVGEHFEEEGEAKMRQLVAVLEPVITVGMGFVVAIVVLAVMLPMFDLATFAQHGP
jgi:type II secretory pathway component PulF